jgi:PEP-CTERM/exosortase A-associated glycosyltransferase
VLDGYSQRSRSLLAAQLQLGFRPSVVTSPLHQTDDPVASETSLDGIQYFRTYVPQGLAGRPIRAGWPLLRELGVVSLLRRRIQEILDSESYDIVHAHSPALCGLAASQAASSRKIPFVYEIRSFWEDATANQQKANRTTLRYFLAKQLETHVVRRADAVVGITRSILRDLEARGIKPHKFFCVSNGVDTTRFHPRTRDSSLASDLALNDCPILGFIGTLFPWEGIAWLVRAAVALRKTGFAFKLLIVGDGADADEVRKAIQENDAGSYVSFIGRVAHQEIERYYSVIDVLVYPRLSMRLTELVTPLKPLEAMALGKAVLGSDVGGIRELIDPEVTGVLFRAADIGDFQHQAARLLQDAGLRRLLGEGARQKVASEKDWRELARTYESVYALASQRAATQS